MILLTHVEIEFDGGCVTGVGEGDLCGVIEFAPGDIESVFRALNRLGEEPR